jgi:hypothetical protein
MFTRNSLSRKIEVKESGTRARCHLLIPDSCILTTELITAAKNDIGKFNRRVRHRDMFALIA